ncbi:hypothetical protein D3C81_1919050 [compost metagenome]
MVCAVADCVTSAPVTSPVSVPIFFVDLTSPAPAVPYSPPSPNKVKFDPSKNSVYTLAYNFALVPLAFLIAYGVPLLNFRVGALILAALNLTVNF